ncbi:RpoH suppressor [Minicystis rosea]|nr:RpoH suppressor [Minicystis rosea]
MSEEDTGTAPKQAKDRFQTPELECDLVMKGGIASGVVYPAAILKLAEKYRFRGIGGASAGAIAASVAAAAEYGRHQLDNENAGFAGLDHYRRELEREGLIQTLFVPAMETAPVYRFLMGLYESGLHDPSEERPSPTGSAKAASKGPGLWTWIGRATRALAAEVSPGEGAVFSGGLAGVIAAAFTPAGIGLASVIAATTAASVYRIAGVVGGALELKRSFDALRTGDRTFYGLCLGSRGKETSERAQLTDWLHEAINTLAGFKETDRPLTIDELAKHEPSIAFKMVTTNLSLAQPVVLPFENDKLFFKRADFERLFPPWVVGYLVEPHPRPAYAHPPEARAQRAEARRLKREKLFRPPSGFYPLPQGGRLPVIVAVRMSLSFPILLSQVRLYSVKDETWERISARREQWDAEDKERRRAGQASSPPFDPVDLAEHDFDESWFGDGGIAANFPLSIFDHWMPKRPTFGINLCDGPLPAWFAKIADGGTSVFRHNAKDTHLAMPKPQRIEGLFHLLYAMLNTAQSGRDNMQLELASYRERVAHVYLQPGEGGLNLNMKHETLVKLGKKGEDAARTFLGHNEQPAFDFDEHRWVRMLQLMDHLERQLFAARAAVAPDTGAMVEIDQQIKDLFNHQGRSKWYRAHNSDEEWRIKAMDRIHHLFRMLDTWSPKGLAVPTTSAAAVARFQFPSGGQRLDDVPHFQDGVPDHLEHEAPTPAGALRVTSEV